MGKMSVKNPQKRVRDGGSRMGKSRRGSPEHCFVKRIPSGIKQGGTAGV
jgi:hypothetical protein